MKTDIKAYKIVVDNKESRATLICLTYRIGASGVGYGAEFYVLVSSFNATGFRIPEGSHSFTFQEEMRIFWNAVLIAPENRLDIEKWISSKMKIVYGDECKVSVENFPRD